MVPDGNTLKAFASLYLLRAREQQPPKNPTKQQREKQTTHKSLYTRRAIRIYLIIHTNIIISMWKIMVSYPLNP